ncbi:hypothetical protein B9Z19DRAFT_1070749 [Tuber borchii]|uniref:Uncharacterized protein n=1 Tax=Tuber borchii TaxID=42251 RepID=A0A2T7A8W8_TUBBO|nr:hypothetical protein B9Z19DRAFT_1070749 [Tuber borchii]
MVMTDVYMKIKTLSSVVQQSPHISTPIHTCLLITLSIPQRNKRKETFCVIPEQKKCIRKTSFISILSMLSILISVHQLNTFFNLCAFMKQKKLWHAEQHFQHAWVSNDRGRCLQEKFWHQPYGGTAPKFCMFYKRGLLPLPPVEHTELRGYTSVE